jgi:hypothetical protein
MIKIFRKKRHDLMEKGKTGAPAATSVKAGKYIKYAIGEIILVVIGILIALQINNFNNSSKQRSIEQEYLLSLQTEFKTNLNSLNDCLVKNEEMINSVSDLLVLFDKQTLDTITEEEMSNRLQKVFSTEVNFIPATGVLTDIISSGNLNLIQNNNLRQKLASFESSIELLEFQENGATTGKKNLHNFLNKNGSVRSVVANSGYGIQHHSISDTVNNKQLFKSVEFENILLDYYLTSRYAGERSYIDLSEEVENILTEIDSEITKGLN